MRLTLRTLLAYLDDLLDPAQTREIGARISENSTASSLVARIRDVTRRRRIGAPEVTGPGSQPDPNMVASYLDNSLDPNAVAEVEKVCLKSDMHLAEVAACHQILTIVLAEPVTIPPTLRERMHALGTPAPAPAVDAASPDPGAIHPPVPHAPPFPIKAIGSVSRPEKPVVPDYLRRSSPMRKVLPVLAVALMIGAWGYLVWSSGLWKTDSGTAITQTTPETVAPAVPSVPRPRPAAPQLAEEMDDDDPMKTIATLPPEDLVPTPSVKPTAPAEGEASDSTGTPTAPVVNPVPPAPTVPARPVPTVQYLSQDGVLIRFDRTTNQWLPVPRRAMLAIGDVIASPEPFTADLSITDPDNPELSLKLQLEGGTRLTLLPPQGVMLVDVALERGRVEVSRGADSVEQAIGLGVKIPGLRTEFDAVSPLTRYGLQLTWPQFVAAPEVQVVAANNNSPPADPSEPPTEQLPPPRPLAKPTGTLLVVNGSVNVRRESLAPIAGENTRQVLEWTNPSSDSMQPATQLPWWLDPEFRPIPASRNAARTFEAEFVMDQPVQHSILPVVEHDLKATNARLALQTMSLINDIPSQVQALTSNHWEVRQDAIHGLREWLHLAPGNAERLHSEIHQAFREQDAVIVADLLVGVSDQNARDEVFSQNLVEGLGSENVAIRELVFQELQRLTRKHFDYLPQNPPMQREAAMSRWREFLRKNKTLLPALPEAPADPDSVAPLTTQPKPAAAPAAAVTTPATEPVIPAPPSPMLKQPVTPPVSEAPPLPASPAPMVPPEPAAEATPQPPAPAPVLPPPAEALPEN